MTYSDKPLSQAGRATAIVLHLSAESPRVVHPSVNG
jgi:hypothetical protein